MIRTYTMSCMIRSHHRMFAAAAVRCERRASCLRYITSSRACGAAQQSTSGERSDVVSDELSVPAPDAAARTFNTMKVDLEPRALAAASAGTPRTRLMTRSHQRRRAASSQTSIQRYACSAYVSFWAATRACNPRRRRYGASSTSRFSSRYHSLGRSASVPIPVSL